MPNNVSSPAVRRIALALLLAATACSVVEKPGPQSIAGMTPVGTISVTEIIAAGATVGKGMLTFQGKSYPFKLAGGVTGGGGAADTQAEGDVYNLRTLGDFVGIYTQSDGGIGLNTAGSADLWLRNRAGVVLHLKGKQTGVTLSLGREEVLVDLL